MAVEWILLVIVGLVVIYVIAVFNSLIWLRNRIKNAWAQIDVQLKKRADLVPALVKVVKSYAKFEKGVLTEVTKARTALMNATNTADKVKKGDMLQNTLKSLFAVAENYPDLKANQNFMHLQTELSAIEDKVAYARQYYNDAVLYLENASQKFPGVLFFRMYGRKRKDYLKIPEVQKEMPEIDL